MDRTKIIALVGGASALAMIGNAEASTAVAQPSSVAAATSYAELLEPIPDASRILKAQEDQGSGERPVQLAQYYPHHHHHYHHHHHWGWHHHHHHWHHHHHHHHPHYY